MARQILSLWEFEDIGNNWKKANSNSIYPIIAIPTTAGTGSEVGRASVITNLSKQEKKIIFHPKVLPSKVICDPELTVSMPANITAGTGLDAFAHSVEAFCSPHYHPMAQGIALEGMRLVVNNLLKAYENPYDLTSRSNMMCAALMGATAFQKGLGAIHAMSHSIGALANSHHGTTNAVCMLPVLRLNSNIVSELFDKASAYLGIKGGFKGFYKFVEKLNLDLNIPKNLIELNVKRDTIDLLVSKSLRDPWSFIPIISRLGQITLNFYQLLFWSNVISTIVLGLLYFISNGRKTNSMSIKDYLYNLILGSLGCALYYLFLYYGYYNGNSIEVLIIQYTWPLQMIILSSLLYLSLIHI